MEKLRIRGGNPLIGSTKTSGAKNAMTKLLVASLISDKKSIFYNVPNIGDVQITVDLCRELGSEISWNQQMGILEIQTKELKSTRIPQRFSGSNRIPILLLGALLGRAREDIVVPTVGGCKIGKRPVDFHLESLKLLGAEIDLEENAQESVYYARAPRGLNGTVIQLQFPSVGATENTILAAAKAKGNTIIKNAAIEPEIIDLILFLQKMGLIIFIDVDRTIRIQEITHFNEVEHTVIPDRIEAASLGMAAISTKGRVFVEGAQHQHMITFLNKLLEIGAGFSVKENGIEFYYKGPLKGGIHIETDVHPGFMTDWQQPFVVLLTQSCGSSVIHETVYENRFGYAYTLKQMGADIELFRACLGGRPCRFKSENFYHSIIVRGPTELHSQNITIPDLRAGFAYVMAALLAKDTSILSGVEFLYRGYENITQKLASLGADISQVTPAPDILKNLQGTPIV